MLNILKEVKTMNTKIKEMIKTINDNMPALQAGATLSQIRSNAFEKHLQAMLLADNNEGQVIGQKTNVSDVWALNFYK